MHEGTFLVAASEESSVLFQDVESGQVYAIDGNPGVEAGEVVDAALDPVPPMEVTWTVERIEARRDVTVEAVDAPPSERAREAASDDVGDLVTLPDDGVETHVITVPEERTDEAVADVVNDEATVERAARLGSSRVEVRGADGVLSVRYR